MQHARNLALAGVGGTLGLLLSSGTCRAAVRISEIMPQPSSGSEWVELHNDDSESVNLSDFTLWDQLSMPSEIARLEPDTHIGPGQYRVIELAANKLNNGADGLQLLDASGQIISEMSYTSSTPDMSWSLIANQWTQTVPTRGTQNQAQEENTSTITPATTTAQTQTINYSLELESIQACPAEGDTEGIYIKNTDSTDATLTDWIAADANGTKQLISGVIQSGESQFFGWDKSLLNNSGDTLTLSTPQNTTLIELEYESCETGTLLVYDGDSWLPHTQLTQETLEASLSATTRTSASNNDQATLKESANAIAQIPSTTNQPTTQELAGAQAQKIQSLLAQQRANQPPLRYYPLHETKPELIPESKPKPDTDLTAHRQNPGSITITDLSSKTALALSAILLSSVLCIYCGYELYVVYKRLRPPLRPLW